MNDTNKESINDIKEVDISPEVSMYNLMESFPYDLGSALSEYVDNSIQSFLENKKTLKKTKLQIEIKVDYSQKHNKKIIIKDNSIGITNENLKRAMKPAFKPDEQSLNEFGIGMKAASVWIGRKWTLLNSYMERKDKTTCQKIVFDLDKLIKNNQGIIPIINETKNCLNNGVIITIENLNHEFDKNQIEDAFLSLEENYQYFINIDKVLDLRLEFTENNNLPSLPLEDTIIPDVLISPKMIIKKSKPYWTGESKIWKKDVNFKFNKKTVTGFVMCRKTSSHHNPGIKIFREKRLIQGTKRNPNRPIDLLNTANKHASLRFYAELHLDGQKISNNKGQLNINEPLFYKTLQQQDGVQDILDQAKNYKADAAKNGQVEEYKEDNNLKSSTGVNNQQSQNSRHESSSNKANNSSKKNETKPIDILDLVIMNTEDLIVQSIAKEAKKLYDYSTWGFVLCYRVIAEKVLHEKIKNILPANYNSDKVANKSIVDLVKWLSNNKKLLNLTQEWKSLDKNLDQISGSNKFNITNLVGHGHYIPTKQEIDTLVANTQKLLEWALSQE